MNNFQFWSPTQFVFGKNAQKEVGKVLQGHGYHKVLIHYGGGSVIKSGLLDEVKKSLDAAGIAHIELGGAQPNPIDTLVYEGIDVARKEKVDFILAVGGGSTIDSAKSIAMGVPYDGDFWDFFSKGVEIREALPVGTVLTIPAAGSEASNSCVITKMDGMLKRGAGSELLRPKVSFMNPELTYTLPPYQTAAGATDMMAHIFERYFSNTKGVELTNRMSEAVLKTIIKEVPIALREPENYDARANIMWAGMVAHNNILGVGREQDWSSHQIEHELSALYDVTHGAGLAVIFPAWMRYQYKHDIPLFAQFAVRVWNCEMDYENPEVTALEGIKKVKEFFKSIGMPTNFKELGAKEEDIPLLASKCGANNNGMMGYFHPLTLQEVEEVYRLACE